MLFGDNGTWSKLSVPADAAPSAIGAPPAGKFAPVGRIGWVWQNGAGVRTRLGWALAPEKTGKYGDPSNGAWQAFSRGYHVLDSVGPRPTTLPSTSLATYKSVSARGQPNRLVGVQGHLRSIEDWPR